MASFDSISSFWTVLTVFGICFVFMNIQPGKDGLWRRLTHPCVDEDLNMICISLCQSYRGNISSGFSSNSEAFASELLENPEETY